MTGYAIVANAGTGTYSFTGGNSSGAHVIAAEFLSEPSAHVTAPTVVNSGASNIQPTTATLGGEVTDTIDVPGRRAVACQLGGDDGKTLFCLTYEGTIEDLHQAKAAGAIETARVQHAAAGSP